MNIGVKKIHENAVIPQFAHTTDTGFDLFTVENTIIQANKKSIVRTGLIFDLPYGWGIQVRNKSGITVKGVPNLLGYNADITVYIGTIDSAYRGELGIMVKNETEETIVIPSGTKLAQGVLEKVYQCTFTEIEEVSETDRGNGGFGSTGVTI
jgi:dUTP pyrophosphatase